MQFRNHSLLLWVVSIFSNHVSQNVKESVYVDENDLSKSLSSYPLSHLQPLLVMQCNTISLTNRFDKLREFLKRFPVMPHLIAITETRHKTSSTLQSINLPQYTFCHADSLILAGGAGVYIKDNLQFKVRSDLKFYNEGYENFWVELVPTNASTNFNNKQKTTIFGVIYKHPSTNINNFTDSFEQTLQKLQLQGCKFYICGDINVNYLKIHRDNKISRYANFLISNNANNVTTKATRITRNSANLIDHFYTNDITNCSNCFIIRSDISDHFPLVVEIQPKNMMRPQKSAVTYIRSFRNFSDQDFCMEVQHSYQR